MRTWSEIQESEVRSQKSEVEDRGRESAVVFPFVALFLAFLSPFSVCSVSAACTRGGEYCMKRFNDFDPTKGQVIIAYLRQGGFPAVAADAAGVPGAHFRFVVATGRRTPGSRAAAQLRTGSSAGHRPGSTVERVDRVQKGPQVLAQSRPRQGNARKCRLDLSGAALLPRVRPAPKEDPVDTCRFLCSWMMEALTPFPDARQKVAELIVTNPPEKVVAAKRDSQVMQGEQGGGLSSIWRSLNPSAN